MIGEKSVTWLSWNKASHIWHAQSQVNNFLNSSLGENDQFSILKW